MPLIDHSMPRPKLRALSRRSYTGLAALITLESRPSRAETPPATVLIILFTSYRNFHPNQFEPAPSAEQAPLTVSLVRRRPRRTRHSGGKKPANPQALQSSRQALRPIGAHARAFHQPKIDGANGEHEGCHQHE